MHPETRVVNSQLGCIVMIQLKEEKEREREGGLWYKHVAIVIKSCFVQLKCLYVVCVCVCACCVCVRYKFSGLGGRQTHNCGLQQRSMEVLISHNLVSGVPLI